MPKNINIGSSMRISIKGLGHITGKVVDVNETYNGNVYEVNTEYGLFYSNEKGIVL